MKLIQSQFPTSGIKASDDDLVNAWQGLLAGYHPRAVFNAYEHFLSKGDTFPPTAGQIALRAKIEHFPLLGLNPMEHKLQGTIFYRIYCAKYGNPPAHNVRGNVDDLDKWLNKYTAHMKDSIDKMKAASNERVEKYIIQMTANLAEFEKKRLEDHSEPDPDDHKPISKEAIEKLKASHPYLKAIYEGKPIPANPKQAEIWAKNREKYAKTVMHREDGLNPTQTFTTEVPADNHAHGKVYTCRRTKHLRGDRVRETRSGVIRIYLD